MDEIVQKLAGFGLPAIILVITMASTGLTGAAAITAALAMLGPGGMLGGIALLGVIGLITDVLTKYGLEEILKALYKERVSRGELKENLIKETKNLPISQGLKAILVIYIQSL